MSDAPVDFKINGYEFNQALARMMEQSKREVSVVLREAARNFVRKVVSITPPATGSANAEARKRGETAIKDDISRIMRPASASYLDLFRQFHGGDVAQEDFAHQGAAAIGLIYTRIVQGGEMDKWHQERRSKSSGRVGFRSRSTHGRKLASEGRSGTNRDRAFHMTTGVKRVDLRMLDLGLAPEADMKSYIARVQARVGILASGWNAAADELGYKPPQWIARHGTARGQVTVDLDSDRMFIRITNAVGYALNVKTFTGRVQKALDWQARDMMRRVDAFAKRNRKI